MKSDQDPSAVPPKRPRMAVPPKAPPGTEQDSYGNLVPFEQRTPEDQEKARDGG